MKKTRSLNVVMERKRDENRKQSIENCENLQHSHIKDVKIKKRRAVMCGYLPLSTILVIII
jgi:hypothetical protein